MDCFGSTVPYDRPEMALHTTKGIFSLEAHMKIVYHHAFDVDVLLFNGYVQSIVQIENIPNEDIKGEEPLPFGPRGFVGMYFLSLLRWKLIDLQKQPLHHQSGRFLLYTIGCNEQPDHDLSQNEYDKKLKF